MTEIANDSGCPINGPSEIKFQNMAQNIVNIGDKARAFIQELKSQSKARGE